MMSEESVMSSSLRDITESTEAEGRDDTHHTPVPLLSHTTRTAVRTPVPLLSHTTARLYALTAPVPYYRSFVRPDRSCPILPFVATPLLPHTTAPARSQLLSHSTAPTRSHSSCLILPHPLAHTAPLSYYRTHSLTAQAYRAPFATVSTPERSRDGA